MRGFRDIRGSEDRCRGDPFRRGALFAKSACRSSVPSLGCVVRGDVLVVVPPPLVWRRLWPALGGVLPLLLAAIGGEIQERPQVAVLVAASVDEVGAVDPILVVAQEHVGAVPLG